MTDLEAYLALEKLRDYFESIGDNEPFYSFVEHLEFSMDRVWVRMSQADRDKLNERQLSTDSHG